MFPLFRKDGQQPSDEQSLAQPAPSSENSQEKFSDRPLPEQPLVEGPDPVVPTTEVPVGEGFEGPASVEPQQAPASEADQGPASGEEGVSDERPDATPVEREVDAEEQTAAEAESWEEPPRPSLTARQRRRRIKGRRLASPEEQAARRVTFTAQQRLLLLDTWQRSGLPAKDFAALVGVSPHTLYKWKKLFEEHGPAGLADQPKGTRRGSRLPEVTKRAILMLKEQHPEWGCQRISDMLVRGPALPASASAVARVLRAAGYEVVEEPTRPHPSRQCRFERARPNELWQTDLFTFVLKRQNRRVYLVAFMDDHSRFIVSYGLHASASTALVLEALEAGVSAWGPPEEILTDNGPQYVTWRGKSQFSRHLEKRGIRQIVARPRRPQTLGKIERFWGTMWREFLEAAIFHDLADARTRIGHFVDYYNLTRVHRGLNGAVPADRFFGAAPDVLRTLKERAQANALELARHGQPKVPFYMTGQMDGQSFSVHAEGERLVLKKEGQERQEIELAGSSPEDDSTAISNQPCKTTLPRPLCPSAEPPDGKSEPACGAAPSPGQPVLDEQQLWKALEQAAQDESVAPPADNALTEPREEDGDDEEGGQS